MGYYEIENLYKDQTILNMKEVYVMEKIHGTSAHVSYKSGRLGFFAGGGAHKPFLEHFDQEDLLKGFEAMEVGDTSVIIYGENYGGKIQGMSATYGKYQSFVAFDVKIGDWWLQRKDVENVAEKFEIDVVPVVGIGSLSKAVGMTRYSFKSRWGDFSAEGLVCRPSTELVCRNGKRVITKIKYKDFRK